MTNGSYYAERLPLPENFARGRIGVVTVLDNSAALLEEFFASVERQSYLNFAVYCVDNASTDDGAELCRARGDAYVVIENEANAGMAAGNNIGTRAAIADGCEYVLYLNNDVAFGPKLFGQLVFGLLGYRCSMSTPIMYYHDRPEVIWAAGGNFQPWLGSRRLQMCEAGAGVTESSIPAQVSYNPTCCVLVRRELFAEIGLMDERHFAGFDDTDFMRRAWRAGKKLYLLPHAKVWNKFSGRDGTDPRSIGQHSARNGAFLYQKRASSVRERLLGAL